MSDENRQKTATLIRNVLTKNSVLTKNIFGILLRRKTHYFAFKYKIPRAFFVDLCSLSYCSVILVVFSSIGSFAVMLLKTTRMTLQYDKEQKQHQIFNISVHLHCFYDISIDLLSEKMDDPAVRGDLSSLPPPPPSSLHVLSSSLHVLSSSLPIRANSRRKVRGGGYVFKSDFNFLIMKASDTSLPTYQTT